jgi:hypothetical protein
MIIRVIFYDNNQLISNLYIINLCLKAYQQIQAKII